MVNRVESFLKIKQNFYSNVSNVERFCNLVNKCDNSMLKMKRSKPKLVFIFIHFYLESQASDYRLVF